MRFILLSNKLKTHDAERRDYSRTELQNHIVSKYNINVIDLLNRIRSNDNL